MRQDFHGSFASKVNAILTTISTLRIKLTITVDQNPMTPESQNVSIWSIASRMNGKGGVGKTGNGIHLHLLFL